MFVKTKPDGNRPLGIPRHRWDYNIKMDIKERILEYGLDSSGLEEGQ
jgi:hypothetical protein